MEMKRDYVRHNSIHKGGQQIFCERKKKKEASFDPID